MNAPDTARMGNSAIIVPAANCVNPPDPLISMRCDPMIAALRPTRAPDQHTARPPFTWRFRGGAGRFGWQTRARLPTVGTHRAAARRPSPYALAVAPTRCPRPRSRIPGQASPVDPGVLRGGRGKLAANAQTGGKGMSRMATSGGWSGEEPLVVLILARFSRVFPGNFPRTLRCQTRKNWYYALWVGRCEQGLDG